MSIFILVLAFVTTYTQCMINVKPNLCINEQLIASDLIACGASYHTRDSCMQDMQMRSHTISCSTHSSSFPAICNSITHAGANQNTPLVNITRLWYNKYIFTHKLTQITSSNITSPDKAMLKARTLQHDSGKNNLQ